MFAIWVVIAVLFIWTILNTAALLNLFRKGKNDDTSENTNDRCAGNVFQRYKGITDNSK